MSSLATFATPTITSADTRDYARYSAYLDDQPLIKYFGEGSQNSIGAIPLEPPRTDTLANSAEMPSALGREFAQTDWSHGQGQNYFHKRSSDTAKALYLEGFDTSEIGLLRHLRDTVESTTTTVAGSGKTVKHGGYIFIADGTAIRRYSDITGARTNIDPQAGEAATTVSDLASDGTNLYAALGTNGIHISTDDGTTWTHHSDAQAILIAFVKERLVAATARLLYVITAAGAAPSPTTSLRSGWTFTDIGESGEKVYASCIYDNGGKSRIYHYGLDSSLNFIEQGSSVLPDDDLCYSVTGYLGMVLLGCGRKNSAGGRDALLYKAIPSEGGYLPIELVAESEGAGATDLSVKHITTYGRKFLCSWSLGSAANFGSRTGIAVYDPALDSFSNHLSINVGGTAEAVLSIETYKGRIILSSAGGVFYEDLIRYKASAFIITSTADFNNAGPKSWDRTRLSYKALPNGASIAAQYSIRRPEENVWSAISSATIPGSTEATFTHANLESPRWTLKIISTSIADQTSAPEIEGFATRSSQTTSEPEYRIVRTFILADKLSVGKFGVSFEVRKVRDFIENRYRETFDYFEADYPNGFYVRLSNYSVVEPDDTVYQLSDGTRPDDLYLVTVVLEGVRNP